MSKALTIWVDESTEIKINNEDYNLVGYLITNSDREEFVFLNKLKQARKVPPTSWAVMHGSEIGADRRQLSLLERWLRIFISDPNVNFHCFLYKREERYISPSKSYEHYFAKQSIFALAQKMKTKGLLIETLYGDVSTLTVLFDRRRSHSASVVAKAKEKAVISRMNDLEDTYLTEIKKQLERVTGRNTKTADLTVRFSFVSSDCFDGMQFSDCMLYLLRQKIIEDNGGPQNEFTRLFDDYFLHRLPSAVKEVGVCQIFEYSSKLNILRAR